MNAVPRSDDHSLQTKYLGTKFLYALVIGMSCLILLLSLAGIIGVWVAQRPIADAAVAVLRVVEQSAGVVRQPISRADRTLAELEANTTEIAEAAEQIGENITDQGVVMTLLPEEKEQQLAERADSVRETYADIRASIASGLDLYRSVNRLPFVSLPGVSGDRMDEIETAMTETQAQVATLRSDIAAIRAGAADATDRVQASATRLNDQIRSAREDVAQSDAELAAVELRAVHLQQIVPGAVAAAAVIITILYAFVIYTQVEVIRLYVDRWRHLGRRPEPASAEPPAQSVAEDG